jgi:hypothetical protein
MWASARSFQKNKKVSKKQHHKTHSKTQSKDTIWIKVVYFGKKRQKTIKFASHGCLGIKINKTKKED